MRYAGDRGEKVRDVFAYAVDCAIRIKSHLTGVRKPERRDDPGIKGVAHVIQPELERAYEAGYRAGASATHATLAPGLKARLERAMEGLRALNVPPAPCPHCSRGCAECNDTGNVVD